MRDRLFDLVECLTRESIRRESHSLNSVRIVYLNDVAAERKTRYEAT